MKSRYSIDIFCLSGNLKINFLTLGEKLMKKIVCLCLSMVFVFNSINAMAASAVAYGIKTVHVNEGQKDRETAVEQALSNCSKVDKNCVIMVKCERVGYGAVALDKKDGLISASAAVCGLDDSAQAEEQAINTCKQAYKNADCSIKAKWQDK